MTSISSINSTRSKSAKTTKYMGIPMLAEFRQRLTTMHAQLADQFPSKPAEIENQKMPDDTDMASMRTAADEEMRRLERNATQIKNINKSLEKIDSGEYGYCDECGGEIGTDRLHAQPTADLCIVCKEIAEEKDRLHFRRRAA